MESNDEVVYTQTVTMTKDSKMSAGLAAIGSATGLIYGIVNEKRWWLVALLMLGGGGIGRGAGYVLESRTNCD